MSIDVNFDSSLRQRLTNNLQRHQRRDHLNQGLTQASVCVIVLDSDASVHALTRYWTAKLPWTESSC